MKRESRTVDRSHQGDSAGQRHLPLVDLLVDTRAELMELAVAEATVDRSVQVLKAFFNWLIDQDLAGSTLFAVSACSIPTTR